MKKYYNENNEFAVIVSYGYGAGWSSWTNMYAHDGDFIEFLFDNGFIVKESNGLCIKFDLKDCDKITSKCKELCGEENCYLGGLCGATIEWLEEGTYFKIKEYDGNESIEYKESDNWSY